MIEAHIRIDRDLIIKGYKKAHGMKALGNGASFYSWRLLLVWFAVAMVDAWGNRADLMKIHFCIIMSLSVVAAVHSYFDWSKKLSQTAQDTELHVILDDEGVTIKNDLDKLIEWNSYSYFKEYDAYLEITHSSGEISFVPKTDELANVIIFTKTKIPSKEEI